MVLQRGQRIAVQQIAGHRVSHQIASALGVLFVGKVTFGVGHRAAFQLADNIAADPGDLRQLHGVVPLFRPQSPPRSRHAYAAEAAAQLGFHPFGDAPGNLGHLIDILNLTIQHGPTAMLLFFNGQDLQPLVHYPAHYANNAAGPDIQRINQTLILFFPFLGHRLHLTPALPKGQ